MIFKADVANLSAIRNFVRESSSARKVPEQKLNAIILAVDEACSNIIQHGYLGDDGIIELHVGNDDGRLEVQLHDRAPYFNPLNVNPACDLEQTIEERPIGGLGILMMQQNADTLKHTPRTGGGNILTLAVNFKPEVGSDV